MARSLPCEKKVQIDIPYHQDDLILILLLTDFFQRAGHWWKNKHLEEMDTFRKNGNKNIEKVSFLEYSTYSSVVPI
jgi:hypothetical protein